MNPTVLSNTTLLRFLDSGGYAILSADRNPALEIGEVTLTSDIFQERLGNLSNDLTNVYLYANILGSYDGAKEESFFVVLHDKSPAEERRSIFQLGEKYHQDSVIYVKRAKPVVQELIYTTGPLSGTSVEGQGYEILSGNITDNYSSVSLCPNGTVMFTLNFDFHQMVTADGVRTKSSLLVQHHARNRVRNQRQRLSNN